MRSLPLLPAGGSLDRCRHLRYDINNERKTLRNESQKAGAPLREAAKAEGIARGMVARGIAESILAVLEVRGITVRPEQREEILGCSDVDRLKRWLREAILPTTEAAARD
jgi:hypothetical protein